VENAWRWFRRLPGWLQALAWLIAWPILGALYFWRSERPYGKAAAVLILIGGTAFYTLAGTSGSQSNPKAAATRPTPTPTDTATPESPSPTPLPSATETVEAPASETGNGCRSGDPLSNVYHPYRLTVISACKTVTGVVTIIRREDDGDVHFDLKLDAPYSSLINGRNDSGQHGYLVAEIVPADGPGCTVGKPPRTSIGTYDYGICTGTSVTTPRLGAHVSITGPYVLDRQHGWMEIHPVWRVNPLV